MTSRLHRPATAAGLTILGTMVGVVGLLTGVSDGLQHQAEDLLQPGTDRADDIVLVAIDRETLGSVGEPWPWPRAIHAALLDEITAAEPTVVAYDVLFADGRTGDEGFAATIHTAPVVLASALTLRGEAGPPLVLDEVGPIDPIASSAAAIGHSNVTLTPDQGVIRTLPLYALDDRGAVQPSLALATVAVKEAGDQYVERPGGIQIGARFIPLDEGELQLNWAADLTNGSTSTISANDVIEGRVPANTFEGKIVLVGVTEPTLGDLHLVPTDKSGASPGLLVHANAINTVLNEAYIEEAGTAAQILLITSVSTLIAVAFTWLALRHAVLVGLAAVAGVIGWSAWRFHTDGGLWNVVWPIISVIVVGIAGSTVRYMSEIRHRHRAAAIFSSYVPAGQLDKLADPKTLERATAGERLSVTVLFCDLRGFTPMAASLPPSGVRRLLNHYYTYAVDIIRSHDGTVMQFVGDEVFAVFGAPVAADDDARRAVKCAERLVASAGRLDAALVADDLPPVEFGIGLHRGPVVAAHVGPPGRRQYAVTGDTVNVGSRLCSHAGSGQIVASEHAFDAEQVGAGLEAIAEPLGGLDLKGVETSVRAWLLDATRSPAEPGEGPMPG